MRKFINIWTLSGSERKGFLVFILIINLLFWSGSFYKMLSKESKIEVEIRELKNLPHENARSPSDGYVATGGETFNARDIKGDPRYELFEFDPNTLAAEGWMKLGLSSRQASVVDNYRRAGGYFYKKEDLKKVYVISDAFYDRVSAYIKISKINRPWEIDDVKIVNNFISEPVDPEKDDHLETIEINSADTAVFMRLKGIGPVLSARIVKFREALGGFYNVEQIAEVYGLSKEVYDEIEKMLTVDTSGVKYLMINSIQKDEFAKHPYISGKEAEIILNYRNEHGPFAGSEDLNKIRGIDIAKVSKVFPYLAFN